MNRFVTTAGILLAIISSQAIAQGASSKGVFQVDVADATNQEILVVEVEYPPGVESSSHRHNAHTLVYVLEGRVTMQVAGKDPVTLSPGETFYESPADIHTVSKNASQTEPARILVYFLKEKNAAASEPAP